MASETTARPGTPRAQRLMPGWTVAAIGGPLLLAATNALVNFSPGAADVVDGASSLAQVAAHPGLTEVIVVLGVAACVLIVPGAWAVAQILAPRTPRLAAIGGWMMATGYVLAVALSVNSATELAVARSGGDPATYIDAMDNYTPLSSIMLMAGFALGALGGGIVLGVAMLRQRGAVPMWAGCALLASEPVRIAGLSLGIPVGPPLASVLILVAFAAVVLLTGRADRGEPVAAAGTDELTPATT